MLCPLPRSGLGLRGLLTVPQGTAASERPRRVNLPSLAGRGAALKPFGVGPLPVRLYPSVAPGTARTGLPRARAACSPCPAPAEPAAGPQSLEGWSRVPRIFGDPLRVAPTNPQGPRRCARHPAPRGRPRTPAPAPPRPGSPGPGGAGAARSATGLSRPSAFTLGVPGAARAPRLPPIQGARVRRGAPPARPTRPRSWPTWPRAGRAEFTQVRLDAAWGGAVGSAGRGPDGGGRGRGVWPHLPGGAAASRASAGGGGSRSGGSTSSSSAGQSRRRSAPAGGSMAAGPQPGPRTRSRRESSPRAAQPTSGGSWSRPQLQHRRARGGGDEARRGGGERRGEAGRGKERASEGGGREGEASAGGRGRRALQPAVTRRFSERAPPLFQAHSEAETPRG